jgi:hypothetical protein
MTSFIDIDRSLDKELESLVLVSDIIRLLFGPDEIPTNEAILFEIKRLKNYYDVMKMRCD